MEKYMQEIALKEGLVAVMVNSQLVFVCEQPLSIELPHCACRFKDHTDGLISMRLVMSFSSGEANVLSIPLGYWKNKLLPLQTGVFGKKVTAQVLDISSLEHLLSHELHDLFFRYTLEDVRSYAQDELMRIIRLMSDEGGCLSCIQKIPYISFEAISLIQEATHQKTMQQERRKQEMVLLRAKEKMNLISEQQAMEQRLLLDKALVEHKMKSLEHLRSLDNEELQRVRTETALRHKELARMEVQLQQAKEKLLHIREDSLRDDEFAHHMQSCKETLAQQKIMQQEYKKHIDQMLTTFSDLSVGISSTADQVSLLVDAMKSLPSQFLQSKEKLDDLMHRCELLYEATANKEPVENIMQTFFTLFTHELDSRDKRVNDMVFHLMKQINPALNNSLQSAKNRMHVLSSVKNYLLHASLHQLPSLSIGLSCHDGKIVRPLSQCATPRAVTLVPDPVKKNVPYKLHLHIPMDGYLWLFNFDRKKGERPRVLYPFIDSRTSHVVTQTYLHKGSSILFPDDVLAEKYSLLDIQSTGEDEMEFDSYVGFIVQQPHLLVSRIRSEFSCSVEVSTGPNAEDYRGCMELDSSLLSVGNGTILTCGMCEYRVA